MPLETVCPVCDEAATAAFLTRDSVPVHQNLLMDSPDAARAIARGRLEMRACPSCGFVFNGTFDPTLLNYGQTYDNTQTHSDAFSGYVEELIERLVGDKGVRDCSIVEVGCGKGGFLRRLVEFEGADNRGHGFDPTYVGPDSDHDGRLTFSRCFYDQSCTGVPADVVVCRHVIEHIAQPVTLLQTVREALGPDSQARVFFETPCVEWILRHQVAWDFFYEHCSLFTADSLAAAFERSGFRVESAEHVFGGQYLWLEATPVAAPIAPRAVPGEVAALAHQYGTTELRRNAAWSAQIEQRRHAGSIALWGAGAKGVTFANLVDPGCESIACVVDVNPSKQGQFLPGTGHGIVSPEQLLASDVSTVLVLNPNYCEEISQFLRQRGSSIAVVDLMQKQSGEKKMKLIIDTETQTLTEETGDGSRSIPLYSREAFERISHQWVKVGWDQRYPYTFSWMGRPIIQLPEDMVRTQEVIYSVKPDVIVETGVAHGGSLIYYASLCALMGKGRVIGVDVEIRPHNRQAIEAHELAPLITLIEGDSVASETVDEVRALIDPGEKVMVLLDSCHSKSHVRAELEVYHPLVTLGSYIVATDGLMKDLSDVPRGDGSWVDDHPTAAAEEFASEHKQFVIEQPTWPFNESDLKENITHWPGAWLRRAA